MNTNLVDLTTLPCNERKEFDTPTIYNLCQLDKNTLLSGSWDNNKIMVSPQFNITRLLRLFLLKYFLNVNLSKKHRALLLIFIEINMYYPKKIIFLEIFDF